MLFMTTVDTGVQTVPRPRRRPTRTATGAIQTRKVFGNDVVKVLHIPKFINLYNHYIKGVDRANQLRYYYTTQRVHY